MNESRHVAAIFIVPRPVRLDAKDCFRRRPSAVKRKYLINAGILLLFLSMSVCAQAQRVLFCEHYPTLSASVNDQWDENRQMGESFFAKPFHPARESRFQLLQNQPNPFRIQTIIAFEIPDWHKVELQVSDPSGNLIYRQEKDFPAGYNEFELHAADLTASGILYYQVQVGNTTEIRKMILAS